MSLPSKTRSKVKRIVTFDGDLDEAFAPQAVTLTTEDEIDISRGDMIVRPDNLPDGDRPLRRHRRLDGRRAAAARHGVPGSSTRPGWRRAG